MGATLPARDSPEATTRFPLERARGRLALALSQGEQASEVSRGLAELAAAHGSPFVAVSSNGRLASSLRGARLLGMEPRVIAPAGSGGSPARLTLSLALRGSLGPSSRASAVAFVAAFVGSGAEGAASPPAGQVADAIGKATTRLGSAFTFDALSREVKGLVPKAGPQAAALLAELHRAEELASVFTTPVPWSRLLAPSPRGRPAAVWVDLSSLGTEAASSVGSLALASLAATAPEWASATTGHAPVLLTQGVGGRVGTFALGRLLGPQPPAPLCGLLVESSEDEGEGLALPGVGSALLGPDGLTFDGIDGPLPIPDAVGASEALTASERDALTPLTLRARMVGEGSEDESEESSSGAPDRSAGRGRSSSEALQQASGDLGQIARSGIRPGKKRGADRRGDYEAGDFELG